MIWSLTRTIGYSTTLPFGVTAAGAPGSESCGVGASMGLRYRGTWACAELSNTTSAKGPIACPAELASRHPMPPVNLMSLASTTIPSTILKSISLFTPAGDPAGMYMDCLNPVKKPRPANGLFWTHATSQPISGRLILSKNAFSTHAHARAADAHSFHLHRKASKDRVSPPPGCPILRECEGWDVHR